MDEEIVLLTSYFNLANGRRQDTADTFRVDPSLPSRTSPDGTAALYIVTESSTGGHMGPRARRLAADTVAWEYSTHGDDSPAPRLRAALRTAHGEVLREFDGHVSVGLSVIAIEHDDVYLGQSAPAQVYVLHEGSLHSISATTEGTSPFAHALGATAGPEISVFRDKIGPNDVLALCSSWFQRTADSESLRDCFGAGTADDIADCLLELGKEHGLREASVIVIEAVPASELANGEDEGAPSSLSDQVDMAVQALAGVGRMIWGELRGQPVARNGAGIQTLDREQLDELDDVSVTEPPPRSRTPRRGSRGDATDGFTTETPHLREEILPSAPGESWNPEDTATWDLSSMQDSNTADTTRHRREHATEEVPVVPAPQPDLEPEWGESPIPPDPVLDTHIEPDEESDFGRSRYAATDLDRVNSRLQQEPDMSEVIPPVQAFPDTSTEPERIYATSRDIQAVNKRPRRFGGVSRADPGAGARVLKPGLEGIDLRQPVPRQAPPWVIWGGIAAIGVLFVVAAFIYLNRKHPKVIPPYASYAAAEIRRITPAEPAAQQDAQIAQARKYISLARANGTLPAKLQQLTTSLELAKDDAYHISLEKGPIVVSDFSKNPGSQPSELATGPSTLYVLDSGKKTVYSITGTSSPTQIVQAGEQDGGFTIGAPQHLTTAGTSALVLDDANTLVQYAGGTKTAIALTKPSPAQKIVQMANIGADVYLLDVAGGQIWKYAGAATGTSSTPAPFFASNGPDITQAVSLVLDDAAMYILKSDGSVLKFDLNAGSQKFAVSLRQNLAPLNKPDFIFTDQGLNYVWIADPNNKRIVQLNKQGGYVRSYVSGTSQMDFSAIKSLVVPPGGKTLYVLSGQKLFSFPTQP